jgi:heptaprenyl diphosphate synthase
VADAASAELLAKIDAGLDEASLPAVVAALREHPATAEAYEEAKRWANDAVADIAVLPEGSIKQALTAFAAAVVDRQQ